MQAFDELKDKFNARIAHTFIFHGATFDYANGHKFLKTYLNERFTSMSKPAKVPIYYDRADGITFPTESDAEAFKTVVADMLADFGGQLPKDPISAFSLIGKALKSGHFALVVDYAESVFPEGEMGSLSETDRTSVVSLLKWAKDSEDIRKLRNPIILITNALSRINRMLREPSARIEAVGIPYPDPADRLEFIKQTIVASKKENISINFDKDLTPEFMARATAGLGKVHIIDIIMRARYQKQPISLSLVKERKDDIIKAEFEDVLQIIEPQFGFDMIGGYEYVKRYLRKNVIDAVKDGNTRRTPMGILFMGPAGTGKTAIAQALAFECGINFVSFNIGRLFNRYVGASEENVEKACWAIRSIRPVIVFIDELDTAISRGNNGDGGTSNRIMKVLLEFMSETSHRGEIIFLSATNRPEDIDFALKRTGRFDRKIPILPPSLDEIPEVYMTMFKRHAIEHNVNADQIKGIDVKAGGWDRSHNIVGSDVEAIVLKALEISEDNKKTVVDIDDVREAIAMIKPSTQDTAGMIASAIRECNDNSLLPDAYRKSNAAHADAKTAAGDGFLL
jgi:SpoVK/Ycf46/Vps4 family AAA+-type ATPase